MKSQLHPWQLLLLILAGWINCSQQAAIEYLLTENRILRAKLGKKRILLDNNQCRRLALKGKVLGREALERLATIVTPDTIFRWHRELVARHWDYSGRRKSAGRPGVAGEIVELVLRMARVNPAGAMTASKGHWRIWGTTSRTRLSPESSKPTASSLRRTAGARPRGRPFLRPTGMSWPRLTSPRSRSGTKAA